MRRMIILVICLLVGTVIGLGAATTALADDDEREREGDGGGATAPKNQFNIMMNYELGMHCTGFEFAYCCVLPPYNSILAQVVKTDKGSSNFPTLLEADPDITDGLGRPYVLRDNFKKYVLRYWQDAQPRSSQNNPPGSAPQSSTLISLVEGNSLLMWNTLADGAVPDATTKKLVYDMTDGSLNVVQGNKLPSGDPDLSDANDNYWNAIWNHLYIYSGLEGARFCSAGKPATETCHEHEDCDLTPGDNTGVCGDGDDKKKVRLGIDVIYPENTGAALHPMGPIDADNDGSTFGSGDGDSSPGPFDNVLTFSTDEGTVVYTQMKVLEDLPVMLTSPRIWEALGLPLTPFEDTINFFGAPGDVDEPTIRPYVEMKAQLHNYDAGKPGGIGSAVLDGGQPVIGMGTAPIDIPNCERCHALGNGASVNSAQNGWPTIAVDVQQEIDFWAGYYCDGFCDSDWYPRLKGAAISILEIHDEEHGTNFVANWPVGAPEGVEPHATRLGHGSVMCQRCHADNVIAVVKSADCGPGQNCDINDPRNQLWSEIKPGSMLIKPLTEAIHNNHKDNPFSDSLGRNGGCQGCHPAHRSDGSMDSYPISEDGLNTFAGSDNRDAAGGCFVGRDVHSNPDKDKNCDPNNPGGGDGACTDSHLNAVGSWLKTNVAEDTGPWKGIWCTNCHSQLGQELWKAENCADLIHGDCTTNPRAAGPDLSDVAAALGVSTTQAKAWLDPKGYQCFASDDPSLLGTACNVNADCDDPSGLGGDGECMDHAAAIWSEDPGICDYAASVLFPVAPSRYQDGNVATIELNLQSATNCSTGMGVPGPDCGTDSPNPSFWICIKPDVDGDVNVNLLTEDFCSTEECVTAAQASLATPGAAAVPVPFSAATDGRDHWLSAGEPHCADCHAAPYVEQSGNINFFPPFNYPNKASLFRYSRGHRDITCQGCHESIHGLYPVTADIDTTTYAQAASMNTDGSHGPLKCGACHEADSNGVLSWADDMEYQGTRITNDFDKAVSWMHTATDEADPRADICLNCHGNEADEICDGDGGGSGSCDLNDEWLEHTMKGRVSRNTMDKVEIAEIGHVAGDPDVENPLRTVCRGCHGDESDEVSCGEQEWKDHLTEGRVSPAVWEYVAQQEGGSTCGY